MVTTSPDLAGQDEALKDLVARFRSSPDTPSFDTLAGALLARGHAVEALGVADRGLQTHPEHIEGRLERARALLALDRPRVAYIELCRALAIQPKQPKAMRLLGRAFKEAGAPERAAQLLRERSAWARPAPRRPPTDDFIAAPSMESEALSAQLGLTQPLAPQELRQVEVTQVIRRRIVSSSRGDLSGIQGPIVDTSQPGVLIGEPLDTPTELYIQPLRPLLDTHPSLLDEPDEPLFEDLRFQVRRVVGEPDPGVQAPFSARVPAPLSESITRPESAPRPPHSSPRQSEAARERKRAQRPLRVRTPPLTLARLLLAAGATLLMFAYAAGLFVAFERQAEIWTSSGPQPTEPAP